MFGAGETSLRIVTNSHPASHCISPLRPPTGLSCRYVLASPVLQRFGESPARSLSLQRSPSALSLLVIALSSSTEAFTLFRGHSHDVTPFTGCINGPIKAAASLCAIPRLHGLHFFIGRRPCRTSSALASSIVPPPDIATSRLAYCTRCVVIPSRARVCTLQLSFFKYKESPWVPITYLAQGLAW